ncbi:MAG: hypothetical protein AAGD35_22370 [Actinomycetota bacterium]
MSNLPATVVRAVLRLMVAVAWVGLAAVGLGSLLQWDLGTAGVVPVENLHHRLEPTDFALAFADDGDAEMAIGPLPGDGPTDGVPTGPNTRGDDAELDELWDECEGGSGVACDRLFRLAPVGSDYERFGLSCGDRPDVLDCQARLDERVYGAIIDGWPLPHLDG